jgi:ribonuclease HII
VTTIATLGSPSGRSTAPAWHQLRRDPNLVEESILWRLGVRHVAGIDEVGRGCLAGPVAAGAVILPRDWLPDGLRDSKAITADERSRIADDLRRHAVAWAVAFVSPAVIDRINILQATLLAAQLAAARLAIRPDAVLLDGSLIFADLPVRQRVLVDADRLCASVAAASVLAKVERDRLMSRLDALHPGYGFAVNKGYAAPEHRAALRELGPSPVHRRTFGSVALVEQLGLFGDGEE